MKNEETKRRRPSSCPFVLANFAMTADGKTAFPNRKFVSFTSEHDHEHMLELRATADAVMSGARTVDSGEVTLGPGGKKYRKLRLKQGLAEYNLRIIVSGSGTIDRGAVIFKKRFSPIIILTTERTNSARLNKLRALADEVKICGKNEIDFHRALRWLREKWKVKRLLCEGGGELHASLIRADLVDEIHLTISPKIFGGSNAPTIADGIGFARLAEAGHFKLKSLKRAGSELFAAFRIVRSLKESSYSN